MLGLGIGFYGVGGDMDVKGSWLPTDESSLEAWYKFGTASVKTGTFTWPDSSANTYDMIQATSGNQPSHTGGPVGFTAANEDHLALASGVVQFAGAFTFGFRVNPNANNVIILGKIGSTSEMIKFGPGADEMRLKPASANVDFTLSSGDVKDDAYWVISRDGSNNTTVYKDGAQVDSAQTCAGTFDISQMGRRYHPSATNNFFEGDIYEIILFDSTSADLIANVTARLAGL